MREFGYSVGKQNIFTFGEIYDDEETIAEFMGRNSTEASSFGIDSALDFPLFFQLPAIAKAMAPVEGSAYPVRRPDRQGAGAAEQPRGGRAVLRRASSTTMINTSGSAIPPAA